MKKSICLYFQVHQPTKLRLYRFFDIGKDSHYYDDFANRTILRRLAQKSYLPMNRLLLEQIKASKGKLHLAFSISGSALEQFDRYAPEVLDSFRELAATGCVEFLCETFNHGLSSLASAPEFKHQVNKHRDAIKEYFGYEAKAFRNTELIYSDSIGKMVSELGFKTILSEGAEHIMGWRSPDYVYSCDGAESLKLLVRNHSMSDDIAFRFSDRSWSEWPLTAEKYIGWLENAEGETVNLFMDYDTFGEKQDVASGIFDFMQALLSGVVGSKTLRFQTPSEVAASHKSTGALSVPDAISWANEERDLSAWLGNELQQDAYKKLYSLHEKLCILDDEALWADFGHLQESDHLYYMCTKFFSVAGAKHNPYDTPYEAFINYMNVLSDFIIRVNEALAVKE